MGRVDPLKRVAVDAFFFEDFIDGYFPLDQSLLQLIDRLRIGSAFVVLRAAPMMKVPGAKPEEPVPLKIEPRQGGQIDWLAVMVRRARCGVEVSGHALWSWNNQQSEDASFAARSIRLAEPAFVRGIGFRQGAYASPYLGPIGIPQEDCGVSLSRQSPHRFGTIGQSAEVFWSLSNSGVVVRFSEIKNSSSANSSPSVPDCLGLAKGRNPIADRFVSDLLSADD